MSQTLEVIENIRKNLLSDYTIRSVEKVTNEFLLGEGGTESFQNLEHAVDLLEESFYNIPSDRDRKLMNDLIEFLNCRLKMILIASIYDVDMK